MKLNVIKQKGKKSGKEFLALQLATDNRDYLLSFDDAVIARVSGMTFAQLDELKVGSVVCLGEFVKKAGK